MYAYWCIPQLPLPLPLSLSENQKLASSALTKSMTLSLACLISYDLRDVLP